MNRRKLLFVGPVLTASGYGVHARQVLRALVDSGLYQIHVESVRWGDTAFIHGDEVSWVMPMIRDREEADEIRYDISVQVTIPNEFRKRARLNIGVTAGIEVDRVSPTWLVKANEEVDFLIVPSYHSAQTFASTRYRSNDGRVLMLQRPITVIPETFSPHFRPRVEGDGYATVLEGLEIAPFNFLVVGLGLDRSMGEDRKNISNTVLWFLREFAGRQDVGLILKSSIVNGSLIDLEMTKRKVREIREMAGVGEFPRIHLLHGRMSEEELGGLYRDPRIIALVSFTHGEGFGLPMLEAAACGLRVIATDWSGHLDFLTIDGTKRFVPVEYDLKEIPESCVWEGVMERGSRWAVPREDSARKAMRDVLDDTGEHMAGPVSIACSNLQRHIAANYSPEKLRNSLIQNIEVAWQAIVSQRPETREEMVASVRQRLGIKPGERTLIYTMPMSGGDVYLSTAVLRAIREKLEVPYRTFFATDKKYAEILDDNPDVDHVIDWEPWMQDVGLLEDIFDEVYTPNLAVQMTYSNWVHRGKGRNLFHELAIQCGVESTLGGPIISHKEVEGLPERYVIIHTGSGKGQWSARRYNHWQDVVDAIIPILGEFDVRVVQVGLPDEPQLKGVLDMRGRTNYSELAYVVDRAIAVLSIDSIVMHMAAHHGVPHVALFGGSYALSTGTAYGPLECVSKPTWEVSMTPRALIETDDRMGCDRACYKNECKVDPDSPCINNIDPAEVCYQIVLHAFKDWVHRYESGGASPERLSNSDFAERLADRAREAYRPRIPQISGYTHVLNAKSAGYPFIESIRSMLGFCSEVVVVDGGSTDGTREDIEAIGDPRIKVYVNPWDPEEPGMDGLQKAFGRAMCDPSAEFLWQQDVDEVVHEDDYEKVYTVARRFPSDVSLVHLPVIELWGDERTVRTDRHSWKWRLSRNEFNITHGIVKHARVVDQKTGRVYAKPGMSDGCEYIDVMTGEYIPHRGFWSAELERIRQTDPEEYGRQMNEIFGSLPCVFHYSWVDIPQKIRNFKSFWNRQWSRLYNEEIPTDRFPDVISDEDVVRKAEELRLRGGEHGGARTFTLDRTNPAVMHNWISSRRNG